MTLTEIVRAAWTKGFTTKSDFARLNADFVAMAASDGLITTAIPWTAGLFGHRWLVTPRGLRRLFTRKKVDQ